MNIYNCKILLTHHMPNGMNGGVGKKRIIFLFKLTKFYITIKKLHKTYCCVKIIIII